MRNKLWKKLACRRGLGIEIALLVMLVMGTVQYVRVCGEYQAMMDYVVTVQNENVELKQTYHDGYDLAQIEETALGLGMIPAAEADVVKVRVTVPQREPEMTIWEEIRWLCEGLFA